MVSPTTLENESNIYTYIYVSLLSVESSLLFLGKRIPPLFILFPAQGLYLFRDRKQYSVIPSIALPIQARDRYSVG